MVRILDEAKADGFSAAARYEAEKADLGMEFLDELDRVLNRIGRDPTSLPLWESYDGPREIRRCVLNRFPYAAIFECLEHEVLVVAVAHLHRQPLYWLRRLTNRG